jgi:DNA-directed RNA polymerase sigma subunit (sigma70/sigma32)
MPSRRIPGRHSRPPTTLGELVADRNTSLRGYYELDALAGERPHTLVEIAQTLRISRKRVRRIELEALEQLQARVTSAS